MTSDTLNIKKRGLGRGLNALFEDEEDFAGEKSSGPIEEQSKDLPYRHGGRQELGIDQIRTSSFQPRTMFKEESILELSESIKRHGVLQPIIVRPIESTDTFEIVAGERRWRAAQRAALHTVPVIVRQFTDTEMLEIALIENLQREDLNPVDEAMGYQRLIREFEYTQEQLAESLGKSRPHVANMIRLLNLPDIVLGHLERGDITTGHARALITAKDPERLVKDVIAQNLSVRETEKLAALEAGRAPSSKKSGPSAGYASKDVDTLALEKEISHRLGMRVSIDSRDGQKGKVSVSFQSLDQLDEILKKLSS